MRNCRALSWVSMLAFLLLGRQIGAQETGPTTILVLNPESRFLDPAKLRDLGEQLRSLIGRYPSLEVKEVPSLQFLVMKRKAKCKAAEVECLVQVGKQAGVKQVLHSEIQKLPGQYLAVMKLVDVGGERLVESTRQRARRRGESLQSALLKGWVDLYGPLIRSQLKVIANVAGAEVFLDGRKVGQTPLILNRDLGKGAHIIEVVHPEYLPVRQEIQVVKGGDLSVSVTLDKKPVEVAVVPAPPVETTEKEQEEEKESAAVLPPPPPLPPVSAEKVTEKKVEVEEKAPGPESGVEPQVEPKPFLPSFESVGESGKDEELRITQVQPIYKQWWFWTAIGAVVTGGVVGLVVGLTVEEEGIPSGKGRVVIEF